MNTIELARIVADLRKGDFRGYAAEVIKDLLDDVLTDRIARSGECSEWANDLGVLEILREQVRAVKAVNL